MTEDRWIMVAVPEPRVGVLRVHANREAPERGGLTLRGVGLL